MGAGSSLRPAFFFGPLNFVCSARCDHDRMRGCLPLRCLPLSLQLPGARGDWVPQLGFQELVWRLRFWAVDFKLGSRKLTSQTPKLKLKMRSPVTKSAESPHPPLESCRGRAPTRDHYRAWDNFRAGFLFNNISLVQAPKRSHCKNWDLEKIPLL